MRKNNMNEFSDTDLIVLCSALMREHTWTVETANANGYDWSDNVQRVIELRTMIDAEFNARYKESERVARELALIEKDYASDNWQGWEI
jgi:hypothetical protein